jgi:hypothetical protein
MIQIVPMSNFPEIIHDGRTLEPPRGPKGE